MERIASRNFNVDYFEKEGEVWVVETQLKDNEHDIELTVELDMTSMTVTDAVIKFNRFPVKHCLLLQKKAERMIGLKVDGEFSRNAMKLFLGAEGCPNIMSLILISIPGILYFYYPYKIKTGKIEHEEFDHMIKTELKNACLAHTLL